VPHVLLLAHPLTERDVLPFSPLVAAVLGACLVVGIGFGLASVRRAARPPRGPGVQSWIDPLPRRARPPRALGVAALGAALVAGRLGVDSELENLAPALGVGISWPLLVILSATFGPVWRYLDPWDSIARVVDSRPSLDPDTDVYPMVAAALAWVWYVSANPDPFSPRDVGFALALYTIATLTGCFLVGRAAWLRRGEVFGSFFAWCALLPTRRLPLWTPPRGAAVVLGVLYGGLMFGTVRNSELWGELNVVARADLYSALGLIAAAGLGVLVLTISERWASGRGAAGTAAAACVPATAGLAVALALTRNRFTTSLQLLPGLLGDPLGRGWDLLGEPGRGLDPAPLGEAGLVALQLVVLAAGAIAGVVAVSLRRPPAERWPSVTAVALLLAVATASLAAT
jgi:hypothetical protein